MDGTRGSYGAARLLTITSAARVLEIGVNESAYWSRASAKLPFLGKASIWHAPEGSYYRAKVTESPKTTWADLAGTYVILDPADLSSRISPRVVDVLVAYADLRPNLGIAIPPLRTSLPYSHIIETRPGLTSPNATFTPAECARDASRLLDFASRLEAASDDAHFSVDE